MHGHIITNEPAYELILLMAYPDDLKKCGAEIIEDSLIELDNGVKYPLFARIKWGFNTIFFNLAYSEYMSMTNSYLVEYQAIISKRIWNEMGLYFWNKCGGSVSCDDFDFKMIKNFKSI